MLVPTRARARRGGEGRALAADFPYLATDSIWRNRDTFLKGHDAIEEFLTKKWQRETRYTLRKELFAFTDDKIAVQFW